MSCASLFIINLRNIVTEQQERVNKNDSQVEKKEKEIQSVVKTNPVCLTIIVTIESKETSKI
jgi:hypothetical protein